MGSCHSENLPPPSLNFKIKIENPTVLNHRSGWKYVLSLFEKMNTSTNKESVVLIDFIEKYFSWGYSQEYVSRKTKDVCYRHHNGEIYFESVPLDRIRCCSINFSCGGMHSAHVAWLLNGEVVAWNEKIREWVPSPEMRDSYPSDFELAYSQPKVITRRWVGCWHNPHQMLRYFSLEENIHSPQSIISSKIFQSSLKKCEGIIVFSEYLAEWLRQNLPKEIPIISVLHPTEVDNIPRHPSSVDTSRLNLVQIGYWLRDVSLIFRFRPTFPVDKWWLPGSEYAFTFCRSQIGDIPYDTSNPQPQKIDGVKVAFLSDEEYDSLLTKKNTVVLLKILDSSCNNAILESLVRATPVIVNRHPAIEEYLPGYPLFYSREEEIPHLLEKKTLSLFYEWLAKEGVSKFSGKTFIREVTSSKINRRISQIDCVVTHIDSRYSSISSRIESERRFFSTGLNDSITPNRFRNYYSEIEKCLLRIEESNLFDTIFLVVSKYQPLAHIPPKLLESVVIITLENIIPLAGRVGANNKEKYPFNSLAIETYLHLIPGLSENFVYFNDDFILSNLSEWKKSDFFEITEEYTLGRAKAYCSSTFTDELQKNSSFYSAWKRTNSLLEKNRSLTLKHIPYALKKSSLEKCISHFQSEIDDMRNSMFRRESDFLLVCGLVQYFSPDFILIPDSEESKKEIFLPSNKSKAEILKSDVIVVQDISPIIEEVATHIFDVLLDIV